MRALTVHQPWAHAIVWGTPVGTKSVENRSWPPPAKLVGQRIAIHASAATAYDEACVELELDAAELARKSIIGTVRLVGWIYPHGRDGMVPREQRTFAAAARRSRFFTGPVGWLLADPRPTVALACGGHQRLWRVPREVERRMRPAQVDEPAQRWSCAQCRALLTAGEGGPSHDGSPRCRCGSIASGGDKAHCACAACF